MNDSTASNMQSTNSNEVTATSIVPSGQAVLFDKSWVGTLFQRAISVELRVLQDVDSKSFAFHITADTFGRTRSSSFPVSGDGEVQISLWGRFAIVVKVTSWTLSGMRLQFSMAIDIVTPFGLETMQLANEPVTVAIPDGSAPVPQSLSDLHALIQLTAPAVTNLPSNLGSRPTSVVGKIDPNWVIRSIWWRITTGSDDKRADSTVNAITVMKSGSAYGALLGDGVGDWNYQLQFVVGTDGNNGPGVTGVGLPGNTLSRSVGRLELQFQSHAHGFEGTDNWDLMALTVYANFANGRSSVIYSNNWTGSAGLRFNGTGTLVVPWPV